MRVRWTMVETMWYLSKNIVLPVLIAIITYLLVNKLGEWKTRRNDCRLGIAILDYLIGEVRTGLNLMNSTYAQAQQAAFQLPISLLPTESWSGMQTIPDQVLLRIIAASQNVVAPSFHPNKIRNVCKDYFYHMCANYNAIVNKPVRLGMGQQNLRTQFLILLGGAPNQGKYLATTQSVIEMLEQTRKLLDQNSKRWFPKWRSYLTRRIQATHHACFHLIIFNFVYNIILTFCRCTPQKKENQYSVVKERKVSDPIF